MKPSLVEKLFVVVGLLFFTRPLIPVMLKNGGLSIDTSSLLPEQNNPITQAIFLAIYAGAFFLLGRRCFEWVKKDHALLLLLILALVSICWSEDPAISLKRAVALVGTVVVGMYVVSRYRFKELIKLLAWSLGLAALLSAIVALAAPSYGVMSDLHPGAWQGIYTHKNILGRTMALGAISFLFLATSFREHRVVGWGGFLLCVLVVIRSTSLTALLALVAVLCLIPVLLAMRRHPVLIPTLTVSVLAVAGMAIWLADGSQDLIRFVGRDATFSGRVDLWQSATMVIEKNPWLGHGYGTGWVGAGDDATTDIARYSDWNAPNSHNGFLNLTLDLGLVGLTLFVIGYVVAIRRAVTLFRENPTMEALWPLAFLTFVLVTNLTESMLLSYNSVDWTLYIATILSLANRTETGLVETSQPCVSYQ